ncbi:hypothetical protein RN001_011407 [Aquatica leii]|uniref:Peptidase S1 domain-containing protein n=1 Tax=Aquatica leii TaxID=1421715 RepID=A0AAN7PCH1_9COLE|nr:hypothetical protein RN001_011407 [Aquatica leii]
MSFSTIVGIFILIAALCGNTITAVDLARDGQFPYQVSLRTSSNVHFCGGSIVNVRWVLTSAQCLTLTTNFVVVVGTNSLESPGIPYSVELFINHPLFNRDTKVYDVGVVKTSTFILYSKTIQPVVLSFIPPTTGVPAVVTGWGVTTISSSATSNSLQYLNTNLVSYTDCRNQITDSTLTIQSTQICTIKPQAGDCVADIGGPLVASFMQYGIASDYACGISRYLLGFNKF